MHMVDDRYDFKDLLLWTSMPYFYEFKAHLMSIVAWHIIDRLTRRNNQVGYENAILLEDYWDIEDAYDRLELELGYLRRVLHEEREKVQELEWRSKHPIRIIAVDGHDNMFGSNKPITIDVVFGCPHYEIECVIPEKFNERYAKYGASQSYMNDVIDHITHKILTYGLYPVLKEQVQQQLEAKLL